MFQTVKRVIAAVITVLMIVCVFPMTAFASIPDWEDNNVVFEGTSFGTNGYYNVISKKDYVLVPGAAVIEKAPNTIAIARRRTTTRVVILFITSLPFCFLLLHEH